MGEGSTAPMLMIRNGQLKYITCPTDPDQLFDLASDPHELENLVDDPTYQETLRSFRAKADDHWDVNQVTDEVTESQRSRTLVRNALAKGQQTPWDFQPMQDASNRYMRNHLDLNDVEFGNRYPRPEPL